MYLCSDDCVAFEPLSFRLNFHDACNEPVVVAPVTVCDEVCSATWKRDVCAGRIVDVTASGLVCESTDAGES